MSPLVLALLSVLLSVGAQFVLKAGMNMHTGATWLAVMKPVVLVGLALYCVSAVVWLAVLARWEVSKAYPLVGLGFALAAVMGWLLGEQLTGARWAGVALICLGAILVGWS